MAVLFQNQAILSGITDALLSNPKHNFYFTQLEQVVAFSSNLFKKRQSHNAIFAFGVATGNVIVLKMPLKGNQLRFVEFRLFRVILLLC